MDFNAYLLDWTINDFPLLQQELTAANFAFQPEIGTGHIRAAVPFERVEEAAALIQKHLNAPQNYVDIQFPALKKTVIVFQRRVFTISSPQENDEAREWALAQGLPPEQADWLTSF